MRRYELMLVLRPDSPMSRSRRFSTASTRSIAAAGGQIVKVRARGAAADWPTPSVSTARARTS